ncbi:NAD(P)-dependent oxidoreductase [Streptomyces solisilvae]|uniref:NAD(P)-dependent oxidoreductase n=1 Tax=Streptomyces malaysiensis TaxID=92644 RepID=UPI0036B3E7FC
MIVVADCGGSALVATAFRRHLTSGGTGTVDALVHEDPADGPGELVRRLRGADTAVHFFTGPRLDDEVLEAARPGRIVVAGPANDCVDLAAARRLGIPVHDTPGLAARSVAEHSLTLLLALVRRLPEVVPAMSDGGWRPVFGRELGGIRLGLIGLGRVGELFASLAVALGMRVSAWSPHLDGARCAAVGAVPCGLEELLATSDAVSLHLRLSSAGERLLGRAELGLLADGALLVNTARAGLLDMAALRETVLAGRLGGVALDVFDIEPLPPEDPLRHHPTVLVTPHLAWMTKEAVDRFVAAAAGFVQHRTTTQVRQVA